ncbi:MAG TPA: hypothetical protein VHO48_08085, partial [Anaerolineaceae bacterium]|nr:hypothetical protein [Anaerolineaceae bacterium]
METTPQSQGRPVEGMALVLIGVFLVLVFFAANAGLNFKSGLDPLAGLPAALLPALLVIVTMTGFHRFLKARRLQSEQIIFPVVCLLSSVGLVMVWRLRGSDGVWQQLLRGWIPGMRAAVYLAARPQAIERLHRWAVPISLIGLALPIMTAIFGSVDETGARLAIKIGSLPAIQ